VVKPISKRLLTKALTRHGCRKISDDGIHEKWGCPCGQHVTAVPRHHEIKAGTRRGIERDMACLPKGWLQ
jgi:hypothetical protein